ncbi:phage tail termination protein [Kitasatospora mediocidica]|uniref:phage tail termination protein n=1 Tax=Kitasatospora mediocidica TaxID=58352 RepID=UPI0012F91CAA|nr:hypothetical protein [Kitasatospora mediocidica]
MADVLPDIEEVLTQWLATQSALNGVLIGTRVPDSYDGSQRVVRVVRLGGSADYLMRFDHPRIDVDCFGPDKGAAWDLTAIVRRLLYVDLLNGADVSPWGASISQCREDVGPQWLDEQDYPNAGRYLIQITAIVHPA